MNAKIVYYSYSGNTKGVAERLFKQLKQDNIECEIAAIHADEEDPKLKPHHLIDSPDVSQSDVIILASPVRGFSVCPIMKMYLQQLPSLKDKKVIHFVTHHFPMAWLGGTQTNKSVKQLLEGKFAKDVQTYVIDWSNKKREDQIQSMITSIVATVKTKYKN